jgi:hypothetical protein
VAPLTSRRTGADEGNQHNQELIELLGEEQTAVEADARHDIAQSVDRHQNDGPGKKLLFQYGQSMVDAA